LESADFLPWPLHQPESGPGVRRDCSLAARLFTPDSVLHSDDATARALSFRDMDAQDAMFEVRLDVVDVNGGRKRKNARHPFARHFLHKVRAALSIGRSL